MSWLIDWLQSVAFTMFGDEATTWAEVLGFVTGGVCVYLVAVQNVWNWPVGIANNLLQTAATMRAVYLSVSL